MFSRSAAARLWIAIEDRLIPALRLTTHERALYYLLVRRTHLAGRRAVRVSRRKLAAALGLSTYTARHYLRLLARKNCVRFLDRGSSGCLVAVRLPGEILQRFAGSRAAAQLASLTHRLSVPLDAAGQPRAWPRSDHFRNERFRARILARDAHRCFYCRRTLHLGEWTLDHVVPVALGGSDAASNLVSCCHECNSAKADMPAEDFLKSLGCRKVLTSIQLKGRMRRLHFLRASPPES